MDIAVKLHPVAHRCREGLGVKISVIALAEDQAVVILCLAGLRYLLECHDP